MLVLAVFCRWRLPRRPSITGRKRDRRAVYDSFWLWREWIAALLGTSRRLYILSVMSACASRSVVAHRAAILVAGPELWMVVAVRDPAPGRRGLHAAAGPARTAWRAAGNRFSHPYRASTPATPPARDYAASSPPAPSAAADCNLGITGLARLGANGDPRGSCPGQHGR